MPTVNTRMFGPYPHNGGWRCQIEINGQRKWAPMGDTPQRAEQRVGSTWFELSHDRLIGPVRQNNQRWHAANGESVNQSAQCRFGQIQ